MGFHPRRYIQFISTHFRALSKTSIQAYTPKSPGSLSRPDFEITALSRCSSSFVLRPSKTAMSHLKIIMYHYVRDSRAFALPEDQRPAHRRIS